jgi:hypothetical protein
MRGRSNFLLCTSNYLVDTEFFVANTQLQVSR